MQQKSFFDANNNFLGLQIPQINPLAVLQGHTPQGIPADFSALLLNPGAAGNARGLLGSATSTDPAVALNSNSMNAVGNGATVAPYPQGGQQQMLLLNNFLTPSDFMSQTQNAAT